MGTHKYWGATVQNLVAKALWNPDFCTPDITTPSTAQAAGYIALNDRIADK